MLTTLLMCALRTSDLKLTTDHLGAPWQGWGTSLCWMGEVFGQREDLADALFTTKNVDMGSEVIPGLGMNIVRYNAGACSWNSVGDRKMQKSKIILPYRQMEAFWLDPSQPDSNSNGWDWNRDINQREMMLKAKRRGADRFELFSNSPVWWMCKNDNPSGAPVATQDNLRPECYEAFATYLAEIAKHSKKHWRIAFTSVDPFNEPLSWWWDANCKQEGCHFSAAAQDKFLPILRAELDRHGLKSLPISASDETRVSHAIQAWKGWSDSTKKLISQINVHGYEGLESPRAKLREVVGDLPIWMSEHGENDPTGLTLAKSLIRDLNDLKAVAWCYWQPLDGSNWGLIDADMPQGKIKETTPKYFVLAQFSRHIRKGMRLLDLNSHDTVAAYDPKAKKLVLVLLNDDSTPTTKSIDLSAFSVRQNSASAWLTDPKRGVLYQPASKQVFDQSSLKVELPAESIITIELRAESLSQLAT